MNQHALRLFVRSIIAEAKDKKAKDEPKKDTKKIVKKEEPKKAEPKKEKVKKSNNLVEMKKELASLKEKSAKIDELISDWEQVKSMAEKISYEGGDIEIGADAKDDIVEECNKEIEKLKKEKEDIKKDMASLEENTLSEINRIKEMMGLTSEKKDKEKRKMVDEKKDDLEEAKKMTSAEKAKKEDIVKGMKKSGSFGKSKEEKSKMYATATKLATKKESMLREGQFIRIKNDFTLDGKNFKKGEIVTTAKEFNAIEAAAKSGKIQKSDFAIVVGNM